VKEDVIHQYRIRPDKVQVIPEGPPTQSYPEPSQDLLMKIKNKYQLELPFMLYPAVTWVHKNHIRLIEALAYLRERRPDLCLRLICVGARYEQFWPYIEKRLRDLKMETQVRFLGFVPEEDLRAIYRLAEFMIQPSLFEASSLPIFEAWLEGTPVACSDATALPDQVMDAALLFDPSSIESIANAIVQMTLSKEVQEEFRAKGFRRLGDFDCERTAKAYRAVYRRAAGFPLTEEDQWLLKWDWMLEPQRKKEGFREHGREIHTRQ
jgi:glycosyltransferase involved in cell wall biosynthesis